MQESYPLVFPHRGGLKAVGESVTFGGQRSYRDFQTSYVVYDAKNPQSLSALHEPNKKDQPRPYQSQRRHFELDDANNQPGDHHCSKSIDGVKINAGTTFRIAELRVLCQKNVEAVFQVHTVLTIS
jgi:hypothetical protein